MVYDSNVILWHWAACLYLSALFFTPDALEFLAHQRIVAIHKGWHVGFPLPGFCGFLLRGMRKRAYAGQDHHTAHTHPQHFIATSHTVGRRCSSKRWQLGQKDHRHQYWVG
jgi:hypothetical protein